MPLPILALLLGGGLLAGRTLTRKKEFARTKAVGNAFVDSLDGRCSTSQLEQPGGLASLCLPPESRGALRDMITAGDSAGAIQLGNTMITQQLNAHQFAEEQKYKWAGVDQKRDQFAFDERKFAFEKTKQAQNTDMGFLRAQAAARRGEDVIFDDVTQTVMYRPSAGTKRNDEIRNQALSVGNGLSAYNELITDVATNGILRDRGSAGFGRQQASFNRMIGEIKKAEALGALDEGVITFATGLTGDQLNAADFIIGDDATSLERLQRTGSMFADRYRLERENIRTLPGVTAEGRRIFDTAGETYLNIQQAIPTILENARAAGGDITGPAERARLEGMNRGDRQRAEFGADMRILGGQALESIDAIGGALGGFGIGRVLGR